MGPTRAEPHVRRGPGLVCFLDSRTQLLAGASLLGQHRFRPIAHRPRGGFPAKHVAGAHPFRGYLHGSFDWGEQQSVRAVPHRDDAFAVVEWKRDPLGTFGPAHSAQHFIPHAHRNSSVRAFTKRRPAAFGAFADDHAAAVDSRELNAHPDHAPAYPEVGPQPFVAHAGRTGFDPRFAFAEPGADSALINPAHAAHLCAAKPGADGEPFCPHAVAAHAFAGGHAANAVAVSLADTALRATDPAVLATHERAIPGFTRTDAKAESDDVQPHDSAVVHAECAACGDTDGSADVGADCGPAGAGGSAAACGAVAERAGHS